MTVSQVSGNTYDVTVTGGDLADLNGEVGLNLASAPTIADPAGTRCQISNRSSTTLMQSTILHPMPFLSHARLPSLNTANADTLVFLVTFSEGVVGVDSADFAVTGTSGQISVSQLTASTYDVTISGGDLAASMARWD